MGDRPRDEKNSVKVKFEEKIIKLPVVGSSWMAFPAAGDVTMVVESGMERIHPYWDSSILVSAGAICTVLDAYWHSRGVGMVDVIFPKNLQRARIRFETSWEDSGWVGVE